MTDVALFLQPIESSFSTKAYEKAPIMHETVILLDNSWTRETQMMHEFSQNKNVKFGTLIFCDIRLSPLSPVYC